MSSARNRWGYYFLLMGLSVAWAIEVQAQPIETILQRVDASISRPLLIAVSYEMKTSEGTEVSTTVLMDVTIEGEKRLTEISAPGEVKGMRMLSLSPQRMYVYLPAFRKVRRIASHVKDQGLMGATYTYTDMMAFQYGEAYQFKMISETPQYWQLEGYLKKGQIAGYPHLKMKITKKNYLPIEFLYYDAKDKHIKTEFRQNYQCKEGFCLATRMKMVDHRRHDVTTEMNCLKWEVVTKPAKNKFSLRYLKRGR